MTGASRPGAARAYPQTQCFCGPGPAEPGFLPRVLEVLAKRGLVPDRCHAVVVGEDGGSMQIDLQIAGADADLARAVAGNLRRIAMAETVLSSEKRWPDAS